MKHHIVVGGSKGIGREFVKKLLKQNAKITILSRSSIDLVSKNIVHLPFDLNNIDSFKEKLKDINNIDSISFFQKYRPSQEKSSNINEEMTVCINATKEIIELLQSKFKEDGLKSIVLIGSIASSFVAQEQPANYHISKSALLGILNFYAVNLGKFGIRVNMVSPSTVIKDENREFYKNNEELYNLYASLSPLMDVVKAEDVSNLVYYLSSENAKFITGQNIKIDGGISLQWQESLAREIKNMSNKKVTQ